jgi:hypothetical protein
MEIQCSMAIVGLSACERVCSDPSNASAIGGCTLDGIGQVMSIPSTIHLVGQVEPQWHGYSNRNVQLQCTALWYMMNLHLQVRMQHRLVQVARMLVNPHHTIKRHTLMIQRHGMAT